MEGVVLYIMLVRVFAQVNWRYYTAFGVISYGKADCSHVGSIKLLENSLLSRCPTAVHGIMYTTGPSENR